MGEIIEIAKGQWDDLISALYGIRQELSKLTEAVDSLAPVDVNG